MLIGPNTNSLKMSTKKEINIKIEENSEVENTELKIKIEGNNEEYTEENSNDESQFQEEEEENVMNKRIKKGFCKARRAQNEYCQKVFNETSKYYQYKLKKKTNLLHRINTAAMRQAKVFIKM